MTYLINSSYITQDAVGYGVRQVLWKRREWYLQEKGESVSYWLDSMTGLSKTLVRRYWRELERHDRWNVCYFQNVYGMRSQFQ